MIKYLEIEQLISKVKALLKKIDIPKDELEARLYNIHPKHNESAENLIQYIAFRSEDHTELQRWLNRIGMSRLAHAESHIKTSLELTKTHLENLIEANSFHDSEEIKINEVRNHDCITSELFGPEANDRRVRIMVTLPREAAFDIKLIEKLINNGTDCFRINCAHDDPSIWKRMIHNIEKASQKLKKNLKVAMDLAGPKIRTGPIKIGAKVRKIIPKRDDMGFVSKPSFLLLVPKLFEDSPKYAVPLDIEWLSNLNIGDVIEVIDNRGKERKMKVANTSIGGVLCHCFDSIFVTEGTKFFIFKNGQKYSAKIEKLPALENHLLIHKKDFLRLSYDQVPGESKLYNSEGALLQDAHISCTYPEVLNYVEPGHLVFFDDGKIGGKVVEKNKEGVSVQVFKAKHKGSKLKSDKGINFPDSHLPIESISDKDLEDLGFVTKHADIINLSFINNANDVEAYFQKISEHTSLEKIGIIIKIETREAFNNLSDIILSAMQAPKIGIMIARGDLAVEVGWDDIGWVQREILGICNAAQIPVVWATQVLENLAKKGLPSRSEITDATQSLKAECVMLNKGLYINEAVSLLHKILYRLEKYQSKSESMLPKLSKLNTPESAKSGNAVLNH
ncbi:MAG: pyruvate kinase [Bacteroidota bacterium]